MPAHRMGNPVKWQVALAAAMLSQVAGLAGPAAGAQADRLAFITAGVRHSRSSFPVGSATIEQVVTRPAPVVDMMRWRSRAAGSDDAPEGGAVSRRRARWYMAADQLAITVERTDERADAEHVYIQSERLVADAETARLTRIVAANDGAAEGGGWRLNYRGIVQETTAALPHGVWEIAPWTDPRYFAYYARSWTPIVPLDELLEDPALDVRDRGDEVVDGTTCAHLDVEAPTGQLHEFWIDCEHGFICRRATVKIEVNGELITVTENVADDVRQLCDTWLPCSLHSSWSYVRPALRVQELVAKHGLRIVGDQAIFPPNSEQYTLAEVQLGAPPVPEVFLVEWPENTSVTDTRANERRVIRWLSDEENQHLEDQRAVTDF